MAYSEEVKMLASAWQSQVDQIAGDMFDDLTQHVPVAKADPELAGLTRASCSSNVESIVSMLVNDIPVAAAEAPVTALEHARAMAKRGAEVDATLRFYRFGQGYFMRRWTRDLSARVANRERMLEALDQTAAFIVEYIDLVCSRVSTEQLAERERRQRRTAALRDDVVRSLLEQDPVDVGAAERTLSYALHRAQLAFMCWSRSEPADLERTAMAIADTIGSGRPLLVPDGAARLFGWVIPRGAHAIDRDELEKVVRSFGTEICATFGSVGHGLDGFRLSRDQADRAQRVAQLMPEPGPACVHFADVAALDLLTRDLGAARDFVHHQLGDLVSQDPQIEAVRRTVLTVLSHRGGVSAAARELGLHRNTVQQRLRRAETLRGRTVEDGPTELHLALLLAGRLGASVL